MELLSWGFRVPTVLNLKHIKPVHWDFQLNLLFKGFAPFSDDIRVHEQTAHPSFRSSICVQGGVKT